MNYIVSAFASVGLFQAPVVLGDHIQNFSFCVFISGHTSRTRMGQRGAR